MEPLIKVSRIKANLGKLGPFLSGSISKQWNVCGTPGCACKNKENPVKHGPYYQLSYSVKGRHSTMFLNEKDIPEIKRRIIRFQKFKQLCFDLLEANVLLFKQEISTKKKG